MCICAHMCKHVCVCVHMYVCTCVHACTCVHLHVCSCVCRHVHVYVCVCRHAHCACVFTLGCVGPCALLVPGWLCGCWRVSATSPPQETEVPTSGPSCPVETSPRTCRGTCPVKRFGSAADAKLLVPAPHGGISWPRSQSRSEAPAPPESEGVRTLKGTRSSAAVKSYSL